MNKSHKVVLLIGASILLTTLFFGLRPKGYDFSNHAEWLQDKPGIHFSRHAIAFAYLDNELYEKNLSGRKNFSIQILLQPRTNKHNEFNHILSLHTGKNSDQLVIGQWRSHIIIMNGDDYAHRKNTPRIQAEIADTTSPVLLTLISGKNNAKIFFNANPVQSNPDIQLELPSGSEPILTVGNSIYGTDTWPGKILGLSYYDRELSLEEVTRLHPAWSESQDFSTAQSNAPVLLYLFNEKEGSQVKNHAGGLSPLKIPDRMTLLRKTFLVKPLPEKGFSRSFLEDGVINLIGFIPLGFILAALFIIICSMSNNRAIMLTVAVCFGVSLTIEILQGFLPTRSSQSLDLILNTFGALIGASLINTGMKFLERRLNSFEIFSCK